jgi:hypothetical protein
MNVQKIIEGKVSLVDDKKIVFNGIAVFKKNFNRGNMIQIIKVNDLDV